MTKCVPAESDGGGVAFALASRSIMNFLCERGQARLEEKEKRGGKACDVGLLGHEGLVKLPPAAAAAASSLSEMRTSHE